MSQLRVSITLTVTLLVYLWVFKSGEPIPIQFGVALSRYPMIGLVLLETCDSRGHCKLVQLEAGTVEVSANNYKLFTCCLPPAINGATYRYRLGYQDEAGKEHTSSQVRTLLICDEALDSIAQVKNTFLGIAEGQALYGPQPPTPLTPSPKNWNERLFYSLIIDRFAHSSLEDRQGLGFVPYDLSSPHASHGGTLQGMIEKLDYLEALGWEWARSLLFPCTSTKLVFITVIIRFTY
jgi:hypothetical protein